MAAKKKTRSKKKLPREKRRLEQAKEKQFLEKTKRREETEGKKVLINPRDQIKMSEVIGDFAAPLLERFEPEASAKKLIPLAVFAWDLAMMPEEEHERFLDELMEGLGLDGVSASGMREVMYLLVDRKKKQFGKYIKYTGLQSKGFRR